MNARSEEGAFKFVATLGNYDAGRKQQRRLMEYTISHRRLNQLKK